MNSLTLHAKNLTIFMQVLDAVMSCDWREPIRLLGKEALDEIVEKMASRKWVEVTGPYTDCEIELTDKGWSVLGKLCDLQPLIDEISFG